tara:strand:+ start:359 stop:469 length:111 start_codon:yes stop_codon:yes gene_type:complete
VQVQELVVAVEEQVQQAQMQHLHKMLVLEEMELHQK